MFGLLCIGDAGGVGNVGEMVLIPGFGYEYQIVIVEQGESVYPFVLRESMDVEVGNFEVSKHWLVWGAVGAVGFVIGSAAKVPVVSMASELLVVGAGGSGRSMLVSQCE